MEENRKMWEKWAGKSPEISGMRFAPTDEELIRDYLAKKIDGVHIEYSPVRTTDDVLSLKPESIPDMYPLHPFEDVWYFFTLRDPRYPNGSRPKREAAKGYWKAKRTDNIETGGCKRFLRFHEDGITPRPKPTEWVMIEFSMEPFKSNNQDTGWVVAKVYKEDVPVDDVPVVSTAAGQLLIPTPRSSAFEPTGGMLQPYPQLEAPMPLYTAAWSGSSYTTGAMPEALYSAGTSLWSSGPQQLFVTSMPSPTHFYTVAATPFYSLAPTPIYTVAATPIYTLASSTPSFYYAGASSSGLQFKRARMASYDQSSSVTVPMASSYFTPPFTSSYGLYPYYPSSSLAIPEVDYTDLLPNVDWDGIYSSSSATEPASSGMLMPGLYSTGLSSMYSPQSIGQTYVATVPIGPLVASRMTYPRAPLVDHLSPSVDWGHIYSSQSALLLEQPASLPSSSYGLPYVGQPTGLPLVGPIVADPSFSSVTVPMASSYFTPSFTSSYGLYPYYPSSSLAIPEVDYTDLLPNVDWDGIYSSSSATEPASSGMLMPGLYSTSLSSMYGPQSIGQTYVATVPMGSVSSPAPLAASRITYPRAPLVDPTIAGPSFSSVTGPMASREDSRSSDE